MVMTNRKKTVVDYEKIAQQESFKQLSKKKNAFLWTLTVIFLAAYMLLPVLTSYTEVLHKKAVGEITLVWFYSFGLFIMTWVLCHLYVAKANKFDRQAKEIIEEYERGAS